MTENPKVFSMHIEKTAGSSLEEYYGQALGEESVFVYRVNTDTFMPYSESRKTNNPVATMMRKLLAPTPFYPLIHKIIVNHQKETSTHYTFETLPPNWKAIHGHFTNNSFTDNSDEMFKTIVFREPLDRMVSHFLHWKLVKGQFNRRLNLAYDDAMSFEDFAFDTQVQNWQSGYLVGCGLESVDLVGVTEKIDKFASDFALRLGLPNPKKSLNHLNQRPPSMIHDDLGIDHIFVERFRKFHEMDYGLYHKALELVNKLV